MTEALQVHPSRDRSSEEIPLRAELLSGERLEQHARSLAEWHKVDRRRGPDLLLPRLKENEQVLEETHTLITYAVKKERRITPAAEWLLDNFYLVEEQIRLARRHLPPQYSRQLPRLAAGPAKGYPRVYDIALELISHVRRSGGFREPAGVHRRIPVEGLAHARRAVGRADHAAARPHREPSARLDAHRRRPARPRECQRVGGTAPRNGGARSAKRRARARRHGAVDAALLEPVRRRADASPPGTRSGAPAPDRLGRSATVRVRTRRSPRSSSR